MLSGISICVEAICSSRDPEAVIVTPRSCYMVSFSAGIKRMSERDFCILFETVERQSKS